MITPEDWERIRQLFHDALDRPPEERAALLRAIAAGDDRIRREVASLLATEPWAEGFLEVTALETLPEEPSAVPALAAATRLGPFEILAPLGAGGMGEVFRARDTRLDRTVAIKVLPRDLANDRHTRERFEREARLVSRLNHPHICTLYDIGSAVVDGAEVQFLVMELLDGETLAARLKRGPVPLAEALQIARDIVEALAAAHAVGIVHRDLKPANVMLTAAGVKLLDFGLARLRMTGATPIDDSLTVEGLVLGTVPYMSPEQLRGEETDARADLFAFGAVLYEIVTGQRAFAADSEAALIAAILERDPPPLLSQQPLAPPALDRLVAACLAKDREHRWQHARDLAIAIDGIVTGQAGVGPGHASITTPPPPSTAARSIGWSRLRLHAVWAVVALAAGLSAWVLRPANSDALPPPNPRPVIVLMDSPLPGRVYDPRTLEAGGTNADDISDALRELGVVTHKENTSPIWHREEQVREQNPDLIISHLSCLYDVRAGKGDAETERHLFDIAVKRLMAVFGYLGSVNPRTRFLVYSRGRFQQAEEKWADDVIAQFPRLKGRLFALTVPGGSNATFRDPATAELLRVRVRKILALP